MTSEKFRKFLESEAEKNPVQREEYGKNEALRDAKILAERISCEDYETLKRNWQKKSFPQIAFVLRKYGLDFKGITYIETLINELLKIKEKTEIKGQRV